MNPLIHEFNNGIADANEQALTPLSILCNRCQKPIPVPSEERMARNCVCRERAYCPYCGKQVVRNVSDSTFSLCEHGIGWTYFGYDKEWWHNATWYHRTEGDFSLWEGVVFAIDYAEEQNGEMWEVLPLESCFYVIATPVRSGTARLIVAPDIRIQYFYRFYFSRNAAQVMSALRVLERNGISYLPDEELACLYP